MHEHPRVAADRVGMQLERIHAVLELVLDREDVAGELPGLAREDEAGVRGHGHRRPQNEAARLGRHHIVDLARAGVLGELVDREAERLGVEEERRDVLEDDPRLREVRDVLDVVLEAHVRAQRASLRRSRISSRCLR